MSGYVLTTHNGYKLPEEDNPMVDDVAAIAGNFIAIDQHIHTLNNLLSLSNLPSAETSTPQILYHNGTSTFWADKPDYSLTYATIASLDTTNDNVTKLNTDLTALTDELNATKNRLTQAEQTIVSQGQTIADQGQTITSQGQTITTQGQTIVSQGQTITSQGQAIDSLVLKVAALESKTARQTVSGTTTIFSGEVQASEFALGN